MTQLIIQEKLDLGTYVKALIPYYIESSRQIFWLLDKLNGEWKDVFSDGWIYLSENCEKEYFQQNDLVWLKDWPHIYFGKENVGGTIYVHEHFLEFVLAIKLFFFLQDGYQADLRKIYRMLANRLQSKYVIYYDDSRYASSNLWTVEEYLFSSRKNKPAPNLEDVISAAGSPIEETEQFSFYDFGGIFIEKLVCENSPNVA